MITTTTLFTIVLAIMTVDSYFRLQKAKEFTECLKEAAR